MPTRLVLLLPIVALSLPVSAEARKITYGSTLKAKPTITEVQDADTAFWPVAGPAGTSVRAPASGQILAIRLKGTALRSQGQDPRSEIHFQHLRPVGGGKMRVSQTTQAFQLPVGGPRGTVTTYVPVNLCVRR